jgi:diguanylate cyclase (GGDEF)-like protein/PAS domain S-box-containing protein
MKHNINILYVEDEPNVREMLGRFISRFCENLYLAENGEEGLSLFLEHNVDIVISDIKMPKMNGIDMVEKIKEHNPKQLVIFTTAHIDSEYLFKAIELQVDGYISKPVDLDKLKIQIDKAIIELEAKEALQRLKESEERSRIILETSQLGVFIYKEKFVYVNENFVKMVGYSKEELYKMDAWSLMVETEREYVQSIMLRRLQGEKFPLSYKNAQLIHKDGSVHTHRISTETIEYEGSPAGLGTIMDITDILEMQEKLENLATRDTLTGIYNRYSLSEKIDEELRRMKRYKGSFSLMMFDIDFFKRVNDTYGHDIGDSVLQEFSSIVMNSIRDTDIFGRWGGEEFLLLAPNEKLEGAQRLAEKIRKNIEAHSFKGAGEITVSIGFSICDSYSEKEKLLKTIDNALYKAKEKGRNCVVYHQCNCAE